MVRNPQRLSHVQQAYLPPSAWLSASVWAATESPGGLKKDGFFKHHLALSSSFISMAIEGPFCPLPCSFQQMGILVVQTFIWSSAAAEANIIYLVELNLKV